MPKKRWDYNFVRSPKIFQELRLSQEGFSRSKRKFKRLSNYFDKYIKRYKSWKYKGKKYKYKIK